MCTCMCIIEMIWHVLNICISLVICDGDEDNVNTAVKATAPKFEEQLSIAVSMQN